MARVQFRHVEKAYGQTAVLKGIDLEIADGEFLVLVGPSGCGKSTLLRVLAGLETLSAGEVWIGERCVNTVAPKDRDIAMVFQNYALYPHLSVYDNLAFGLKMRKTPKPEIQRRVAAVAEKLGLASLLDRKPKALSGGQRQRVALGRAMVREPQVFLMDEPLSNLDTQLRVQMRAEISRLQRELGTTTVYVTHDQTEAMTMGHRIVVLNQGVIQQVDDPLTLYRQPANRFVAGFIGQMSFIPGRVAEGGFQLEVGGTWPLPAGLSVRAGQRLELGLRPEHLTFSPEAADGEAPLIHLTPTLIEPLGHETWLHGAVGDHPLVAQLPPEISVRRGEAVPLRPNLAAASWFDVETCLAVSASAPVPA